MFSKISTLTRDEGKVAKSWLVFRMKLQISIMFSCFFMFQSKEKFQVLKSSVFCKNKASTYFQSFSSDVVHVYNDI